MSRKNLFYTACIFVFILCASAGTMAKQPNGNHYGNDKNGINANSDKSKKIVSVPEPSTLALVGLGLAGLVVARMRKK
jgi:hypothetical protein